MFAASMSKSGAMKRNSFNLQRQEWELEQSAPESSENRLTKKYWFGNSGFSFHLDPLLTVDFQAKFKKCKTGAMSRAPIIAGDRNSSWCRRL